MTLLPESVDSDEAQLGTIERGYARDAGNHWQDEAEQLAARAAPRPAARALLWLGAVALQADRLERAQFFFAHARLRAVDSSTAALAARGLGDVALARHAWRDAISRFQDAQAQGDTVLAHELDEKLTRARIEFASLVAEYVAWGMITLYLVWYLRAWRGAPLSLPLETKLLAPVYALCVLASWGRDPSVPYAILYLGVGSLVLVTVAFAPSRDRRRLDLDLTLVLLGNAALFYVALRRAGVASALWETLKFGTDMG